MTSIELTFEAIYMLWFNFILGLIFISLCFKLIIIYYHAPKQREIKIKPRIKLNHNINFVSNNTVCWEGVAFK